MSGTRSPSPTAPAIDRPGEALVIVAHGDRGGLMANRLAQEIARRVAALGRFDEVAVGYLRGAPSLETVGRRIRSRRLVVYPLFMSSGYYVREAIPEQLGIGRDGRDRQGRPVRLIEPVGVRPGLAGIVAGLGRERAQEAGWAPTAVSLLLVAHGSTKDPSSREAALAVASGVERRGEFRCVHAAFLEEPPLLDDQLTSLAGPMVVIGLFIGEGRHGSDDLESAVRHCGRADVALAIPLARWPEFTAIACEDLLAAADFPSSEQDADEMERADGGDVHSDRRATGDP